MTGWLDNPFWHALTGLQSQHACGRDAARRFAPGFSPILGFADPQRPSFAGLDGFCSPGERFHCDAWPGDAPPGWKVEVEVPLCQMVWDAPQPPETMPNGARPLAGRDVPQMLALAEATKPGPFGPRTQQLGEYWGIFEGDSLVAMAGERLHLPGLREVSGVCTLPAHRGRGHARALVALLVSRQLARGERPFLHVAAANERARSVYSQLGFVERRDLAVRVVARLTQAEGGAA